MFHFLATCFAICLGLFLVIMTVGTAYIVLSIIACMIDIYSDIRRNWRNNR